MWVCVHREHVSAEKEYHTKHTVPSVKWSEQEKRKWERSRSNLRENKDEESQTWWEIQMSSYLCHVLLALLCTDHSLNLLLYFGNKTLTQCFALGCMTVFAALLHCSTYKSSCYFLDTEFQGLEIQIHNEAAWLLANKPLVVICISVTWFFSKPVIHPQTVHNSTLDYAKWDTTFAQYVVSAIRVSQWKTTKQKEVVLDHWSCCLSLQTHNHCRWKSIWRDSGKKRSWTR